jgi:hypothetical protein
MIFSLAQGQLRVKERDGRVQPLPLPIDETLTAGELVIFACLFHWLQNETQARAVVGPTAKMFPKKLGSSAWVICLDELQDAVLLAFCAAKEAVSGPALVEYVGGQRRDTLREPTASGCRALPNGHGL